MYEGQGGGQEGREGENKSGRKYATLMSSRNGAIERMLSMMVFLLPTHKPAAVAVVSQEALAREEEEKKLLVSPSPPTSALK